MKLKTLFIIILGCLLNLSVLMAQNLAPSLIPHKPWKLAAISPELPASVDNNKLKYFPPVFLQIGNSCAQASTVGYMCTYEMNRLLDRDAAEKSNRFNYLYSWNFVNGGLDEGSLGTDGLNIAYNTGLMSESDFPRQVSAYDFKWATGYDHYYRALHNKVIAFNDIDVTSEDGLLQLKHYLWNKNEPGKPGGVVIFSSLAVGWKFNNSYKGPSETGYKSMLIQLGNDGPHGMTITGYDDTVEFTAPDGTLQHGAFIVTNSHGMAHDRGHYYLPYWFFLQDRTNSELSLTVTGADMAYEEPELVFKVNLDYSSRDDLSFKVGVSPNTTDKIPLHDYIVPIMNHQGGDHPMQGNDQSSQMEVAFDFTSHLHCLEGMTEPNFFLTVTRAQKGKVFGKGTLNKVTVYDYRNNREEPQTYVRQFYSQELLRGENIFSIPTGKIPQCSYSPVTWLDKWGKVLAAPFVFRTADGKYAKVRFMDYDRKEGKIKVKYVYNANGGRNFK